MNILDDLNRILTGLGLDVETGLFTGEAPDEYVVITPMFDTYPLYADNKPVCESQEARISLFSQKNYINRKHLVAETLINLGFTISGTTHLGREVDTGYFNVAIDVKKCYEF